MRVGVPLLLVVVLALGVWWFLDDDTAPDPTPERGPPTESTTREAEAPVGPDQALPPITDPDGLIHGLVTCRGKPVSGCPVYALPAFEYSGGNAVMASSGANGRYTLNRPPSGAITVFAWGFGYASTGLAAARRRGAKRFVHDRPVRERLEINLEVEPAGVIRGRVTGPDGAAVAGATVEVTSIDGEWGVVPEDGLPPALTATTDPDGRYRLLDIVPDLPVRISAELAGRLPARSASCQVASGGEIVVDLSFPPSRRLELTVLSAEDGAPIVGAWVEVFRAVGDDWEELPGGFRTDERGRIAIAPLPLGRLAVDVIADDYVELESEEPIPDSEDGDLEFTVRLTKGCRISGRVLRSEGSPYARGGLTIRPVDPAVGGGLGLRTDREGRFEVVDLPPGEYELCVGRLDGSEESCRVQVRAGTEDVIINLDPAKAPPPEPEPKRSLAVSVVDRDGRPVQGGRIIYQGHARSGRFRSEGPLSKGQEQFRIKADQDKYWLAVYGARSADGELLETLIEGPFTPGAETVTLTLGPAKSIEGTVVDGRGVPVRGVELKARPAPGRVPFPWPEPRDGFGVARSEPDGAFRVAGLGRGDFELLVTPPPEFAPHEPVVATGGARGVRIVLGDAARAKLRVLDGADRPVAGVRVAALVSDRDYPRHFNLVQSGFTDQEGWVTLAGLAPTGSYRLTFKVPEDRPDLNPVKQESWRPADGVFRLARSYVVRGVVRTSGGEPVPGISVCCRTDRMRPAFTRTGGDGSFVFARLSAGPLVLRVEERDEPAGASPRTGEVTAQAGDENVVLIHDP